MGFTDNLPISESIGVFVGVAGFDWLADGQAEPVKAVLTALAAGGIIAIARLLLKHRKRR